MALEHGGRVADAETVRSGQTRRLVIPALTFLLCLGVASAETDRVEPQAATGGVHVGTELVQGPDGESHEIVGGASWYAGKFQGRLTANGERFDTNLLTAAHRTLPFDTIVLVTNTETGESVEVRINDRGPFVDGRVIDLSRAAAGRIGAVSAGVVPVELSIVTWPPEPEFYSIQVASFGNPANAAEMLGRLESAGLPALTRRAESGVTRVFAEPVPAADLESAEDTLRTLGFSGFITRVAEVPRETETGL